MVIRQAVSADAERCGEILFRASEDFADRHAFVRDYPTPESGLAYARFVLDHPAIYGLVAEEDGRIVGLNCLKEINAIRGIGPLAVDPSFQSDGVGRRLMEAALRRAEAAPGVRLVQVAYHLTSLSLYASLGFAVREPIMWMQGRPTDGAAASARDIEVRVAAVEDLDACRDLCVKVHGFDRTPEFRDRPGAVLVALQGGRRVGYLSDRALGKLTHAVAESHEALQALILAAAATSQEDVSLLVPTRDEALFRWCLSRGMRAIKPMTLMTMGFYQEPRGRYLPSVQY